jgi:hypothetical protein
MASGQLNGQRETAASESRQTYWRRVLRPLFWWLLLVLGLYGIRTHERWMEQTRLNFTITLAGQPPFPEATATFDGQPIFSGQKIPLGQHQFAVTHPKGEAYATNLFIWYGAHNFGTIDLKRTMSVLSVTADPPAPVLTIHGPELDVELTNSPGLTSSVPTDRYVIRARYAHWSQSDEVLVSPGRPAAWRIAPRLGAAQITCNQADATGQFIQADGQIIENVTFPYAISELPEGTYKVAARHHNDVLSRTVTVVAGTTNQLSLEFLYGTAVLETEPPGAAVRTVDGRYWGITPLKVIELKPGIWTFGLQHDGYEAATTALAITADQATSFHTNLISLNYTGSMKAARQAMDKEDYDGALKAAGLAIIAKPGDAEALTLQRNATGLGSLQRAKKLGTQGDFMGGQKELATTLGIFPDNAEARALLAEYKRREPEQIERLRLERLEHGNLAFKNALLAYNDADLFEQHEFKSTGPVDQVYAAILNALQTPPAFQISKSYSPSPETYQIEFKQGFSTFLATSAGHRVGVIVCAQTKDDETQILFKILEYKSEAQIKFSIGNLIGAPVAVNYVPISPSRLGPLTEKLQARLNEGVTNVTARIQGAIGQTPPPSSQ